MRGEVLGSRRSVKHGASIEFSDFREYIAGDDLRYVDWKAYGRLEKLFVKLFREEDDLSLHLLLDASGSMAFGAPVSKLHFAKQLSAALGAIALMQYDRCSIAAISTDNRGRSPTLRGRRSVSMLLHRIAEIGVGSGASVAAGLSRYAQSVTSPGVLVIVSDFYEHGLTSALLARASRRLDIVLAHVVSPEEVDPSAILDLSGDVRLIDVESQGFVELTVTPAIVEEYRLEFSSFCEELSTMARSAGAGYLRVVTNDSLEEVVLGALARKQIVRTA